MFLLIEEKQSELEVHIPARWQPSEVSREIFIIIALSLLKGSMALPLESAPFQVTGALAVIALEHFFQITEALVAIFNSMTT